MSILIPITVALIGGMFLGINPLKLLAAMALFALGLVVFSGL